MNRMEKHFFIKENATAKIPCPDESDFYNFCRMNGFIPDNFVQENGWRGLVVELVCGSFVYFYGDSVMRFYEGE